MNDSRDGQSAMKNEKPDRLQSTEGPPPAESAGCPQPVLRTSNLVLRPFNTQGDPEMVQQILQCREIAANTRTIPHPYPEGAALKWIETHAETWQHGKGVVYAICQSGNPEIPVGAVGLLVDEAHEHAELGYWIAESAWGQGICTEAAARMLDFGFHHMGLHRIHAHHLGRNPASGRVMEKIGMQREGTLRHHVKKWGVFEDAICYGVLAEDHEQKQGR